jgi:hypothetical protein
MSYRATNLARGRLASPVAPTDTTFILQAGAGDLFPAIAGEDWTFVTFEDTDGNHEVVKVTARAAASDTFTCVRAQEGTAARAWAMENTVVGLRMVASLVETAMGHPALTAGAHADTAISAAAKGTLALGTVASQLAALEANKLTAPSGGVFGLAQGGTGATDAVTARVNLGIEKAEVSVTTTANATTDIGAAASQNVLLTPGVTTITGFKLAPAGTTRRIRFNGAITMTYSSTFRLPTGAVNLTSATGDQCEAFCDGTIWWLRYYTRASGIRVADAPDVQSAITSAVAAHANRTDNPHGVTAAQLGAVTNAQLQQALAGINAILNTCVVSITAAGYQNSSLGAYIYGIGVTYADGHSERITTGIEYNFSGGA